MATTPDNTRRETIEALEGLLDYVDRETCVHESTHRGAFQAGAALRSQPAPRDSGEAMREWQPIGQAPKGTTKILVGGYVDGEWNLAISQYEDLPHRRGHRHRNGACWATHFTLLPETRPPYVPYDQYTGEPLTEAQIAEWGIVLPPLVRAALPTSHSGSAS